MASSSAQTVKLISAFAAGAVAYKLVEVLCRRLFAVKDNGFAPEVLAELLAFVHQKAQYGNSSEVLDAIEEFLKLPGHNTMVLGKKAATLEDEIKKKAPKVVLELGGYFGYSALKIARLLDDDALLISVEPNPVRAAVATRLLAHAGLGHRVHIINDYSDRVIGVLASKYRVKSLDLVFIDHIKTRYLADLKLLEAQEGLLKPGTVFVADNILYPGVPDYKEYVTTSPKFKTVIIPYKQAAFGGRFDDEVAVSVML
eukprot:TRINITY_DN3746_c0_g1_i1.p1 TRINITY_DN3746_c0_g1~~TRINITY_DN3746_c0_g1_i1.p1  ORF type:complete len:256 (-),score=87.49 TRINITY_DN3746_c0_g1_i1:26-793(-)